MKDNEFWIHTQNLIVLVHDILIKHMVVLA
jgi:hypothetical protein